MATVYSKQLAVFSTIGFAPVTVYTCPAGFTGYVRTISAVTGRNLLTAFWALTHHPSGARIAGANHTELTNQWTMDLLNGAWILNPGESLSFLSDGSDWDLMLSGYELALP